MSNQLYVQWSAANQQWMVLGGGLPQGTAWAGFDSRDDAVTEASEVAEDIGVDVVLT